MWDRYRGYVCWSRESYFIHKKKREMSPGTIVWWCGGKTTCSFSSTQSYQQSRSDGWGTQPIETYLLILSHLFICSSSSGRFETLRPCWAYLSFYHSPWTNLSTVLIKIRRFGVLQWPQKTVHRKSICHIFWINLQNSSTEIFSQLLHQPLYIYKIYTLKH